MYWSRLNRVMLLPAFFCIFFGVVATHYSKPFFASLPEWTWHGYSIRILALSLVWIIVVYYAVSIYIQWLNSEYAITDTRVMLKTGWLDRYVMEIPLARIEAVTMQQSWMGRFLDYGTVVVVGTGGSRDVYVYVRQPLTFHRVLQTQMTVANKRFV